jgi:hypothetical protein
MSAASSAPAGEPPHPGPLTRVMSHLPSALAALGVMLTVCIGLGIAWVGVDQGVQIGSVAGLALWGGLLLAAERREDELLKEHAAHDRA